MKKLKKIMSRLLSLAVAAVTTLSVGLNASAAAINHKWSVDQSAPDVEDHMGWKGNGSTIFSVDDTVHTNDSQYSIKIENTDYNYAYVEKIYNVEPNTEYRFSAMVKYSKFQLDPNAKKQATGAYIRKNYTDDKSNFTISNEWTLLEFKFVADSDTVRLCLQNGIYNGECKGTAWFSDIKLEKAGTSNEWNILSVFFKNADAYVTINGKSVHHKKSFSNSQIDEINTYALDNLPSDLETISNNKIKVNSIDCYYVEEILTETDLKPRFYQDDARTIPSGYMVDYKNSELVGKVLDKYLAQKNYNQILIYVPLNGIDGGWRGLGGHRYKSVHLAQMADRPNGSIKKDSRFPSATIVHEICHGLETDSNIISGDKTAQFHDMYNYTNISTYDWMVCYMNDTLPDGKKGVDPSVFYRSNGQYVLVDDDMTTGTGITPGSGVVTGDINNDGKFTLADVTAALKMYVNDTPVDQRTLNAAGISGRTKLMLSDVTVLLKMYVDS